MKLFTTPAIKRDYNAFTDYPLKRDACNDGYSARYWFCVDTVRNIFGLPQNVTKVWFEFHDRAGVNRWRVQVDHITPNSYMLVKVDGVEHRMAGYTVRFLIKRLGCTECFVSCHYEAEGDAPTPE